MKHVLRIVLALAIAGLFVFALSWSAVDITKSSNYKTYELNFLVNLSGIEDSKKDSTINDVKVELDKRLHKFDVANVKSNLNSKDNNSFINLEFGTIDDINVIKPALSLNDIFVIKEKLAVEMPTEEVAAEENTTTETETPTTEETVTEETETTPAVESEEVIKPEETYKAEIEAKANEALQKVLGGETFEIVAQNEVERDPLKIVFAQADWMYKDEIKDIFAEKLFNMEPGQVSPELIKYQERPFALAAPIDVFAIVKLLAKEEIDRSSSTPKQVEVSHILIAYKDAMRAAETTVRSKEEAKSLADEIKTRLDNQEDYANLAKEFSDDTSNKATGGLLRAPAGTNTYVEQFENAALNLEKEGQISDVIESPFGFHIIKAGKITAATEESHKETRVKFAVIFYAVQPNEWNNTELTRKHLNNVEITYTKEYDPYLTLNFNEDGKLMLKSLTEKNMNNILGIFVGKELITSFTVQEVNDKGVIKILRPATTKEADDLKAKLTQLALPAPVILIDFKDTTPQPEKTEVEN